MDTAPLTVTTAFTSRGPLLLVAGDVDHDQAPLLVHALEDVLEYDVGRLPVTVDLARVSFCDTALLHALLDGHRLAEDVGTVLRLARPPWPVTRLLEVTDAMSLFVAAA